MSKLNSLIQKAFLLSFVSTADLLFPNVHAETLRIDFGADTQQVQTGFLEWSGIGSDTTYNNQRIYTVFGQNVTINLSNSSDGTPGLIDWRIRDQVTGTPLNDLIEDAVKQAGKFSITFSNLPTGYYELVTYHHNPNSYAGKLDFFIKVNKIKHSVVDDFHTILEQVHLLYLQFDSASLRQVMM